MQFFKEHCFLLVLAVVIPTGLSLKCFQCNSAEYPECSDVVANDTSSVFLKECTGLYNEQMPFCRKLVTKVKEGEHDRTIRSCGWILKKGQERKDHCRNSNDDFINKRSCSCFSEMCNEGTNKNVAFYIIPVLLVMHLTKYVSFS